MRRLYLNGELRHGKAKEVGVSTITLWKYKKEFEQIKLQHPDRLTDMDFYITPTPRFHRHTPMYIELAAMMPELMANEKAGTKAKQVWRKYRQLKPNGYSYDSFKDFFCQWIVAHPLLLKPNLLPAISEKDLKVLNRWRHGNDHRRWRIAVTLTMAATGSNVTRIMDKTESTRPSINRWIAAYHSKGLIGLELPKKTTPEIVINRMKSRKENLVKLLHETPKLHGINRTSWSIKALSETYNNVYKDQVSYMQLSYCLKRMGYSFKKTRDMLTSQDPKFREKIKKIQEILGNLKPNEKFFSIDEYGPVGIRIRAGRTLKHKSESPDTVPQDQKCRGSVICIAALELSKNQITHFYAAKKNTFEMIKLVDLLATQYSNEKRIYLSWDAVSWHRSKILTNHIADLNNKGGPIFELVPLPSCTQFLNVIESVFCGLAKAVIHNSAYESTDECKTAIDLHFKTRNEHFIANPMKAGKKIWGKEEVVPKFSDTNFCRNKRAMRGVKSSGL